MLLRRENPRLTRDQIDRIYDAFRSWATNRAAGAIPRELSGHAGRPRDRWTVPRGSSGGTRDAYLPCEQPGRQREAFASAKAEPLEGPGHWAMLEDPGRVASLVVPLLRRQLPGPATRSPASQPSS